MVWRYISFLFFLAFLTFLVLGTLYPLWVFFLAAECAGVGLGIQFGWRLVKFDRSRVEGVKRGFDLNQLGFFNSRIAMRSPELFDITIADLRVSDAAKETARELVRNYWEPKRDDNTATDVTGGEDSRNYGSKD